MTCRPVSAWIATTSPLGLDGVDRPPVAVLHPVGRGDAEATVVAAGDDRIAGAQRGIRRRAAPRVRPTPFCAEPVGSGASVERRDLLARRGQQQRVLAGGTVGPPRLVRGQSARSARRRHGPAWLGVEVEGARASVANRQRGGRLVRVREPDRCRSRLAAPRRLGEVAQHAAGADRGELPIVTDQPDARAGVDARLDEAAPGRACWPCPPRPPRSGFGGRAPRRRGRARAAPWRSCRPARSVASPSTRAAAADGASATTSPPSWPRRGRARAPRSSCRSRPERAPAGSGRRSRRARGRSRLPVVERQTVGRRFEQCHVDRGGADAAPVERVGRVDHRPLGLEHGGRAVELGSGNRIHARAVAATQLRRLDDVSGRLSAMEYSSSAIAVIASTACSRCVRREVHAAQLPLRLGDDVPALPASRGRPAPVIDPPGHRAQRVRRRGTEPATGERSRTSIASSDAPPRAWPRPPPGAARPRTAARASPAASPASPAAPARSTRPASAVGRARPESPPPARRAGRSMSARRDDQADQSRWSTPTISRTGRVRVARASANRTPSRSRSSASSRVL